MGKFLFFSLVFSITFLNVFLSSFHSFLFPSFIIFSWFSLFLFISSLSSSLGVFFVSIFTLCWRLILLISSSSVTSSPFSGSFIAIFSLGWIFCPFMIFLMLYILWFMSFPLFPSSLYIVRISSEFFFPFGFLWFLLFHFIPLPLP